jgi:hypothetical protein
MGDLRRTSKTLFGSQYRLELACAVADVEPGVFYVRQLAERVSLPDNVVLREIGHFCDAGLLERLDKVDGQQAVYYRRADSHFWALCLELRGEVAEPPAPPGNRRA